MTGVEYVALLCVLLVLSLVIRQGVLLRTPGTRVVPASRLARTIVATTGLVGIAVTVGGIVAILVTTRGSEVGRATTDDLEALWYGLAAVCLTTILFVTMWRLDSMAIGFSEAGVAYGGWLIPWEAVEVNEVSRDRLDAEIAHTSLATSIARLLTRRIIVRAWTHDTSTFDLPATIKELRGQSETS